MAARATGRENAREKKCGGLGCNKSTGLCVEFYHCVTDGLDSLKMRTRHAKEDTAAPGTQADQICVCRDSFKCV